MRVPFLDLRREYLEVEGDISGAVTRVLESGRYIFGEEVEAFEAEWAQFCAVRDAAAVGSGTDALALALLASEAITPGRGDEVITTPMTSAYTALAILNAGAVPVFADIDPRTLTLDPGALEGAITSRTRAVIPVHLYGRLADVPGIGDVAARYGLVVIEDAAQAHGARRDGWEPGSHSHAAIFSFYPTKNLGALGDGGAVTSNDEALIGRVRTLRQGGHVEALGGEVVGRNSRMDEIQAAVLRAKLPHLEDWNGRRRLVAQRYAQALDGRAVELPDDPGGDTHVFHLYVIGHRARDGLRRHLSEQGIETAVHYPYVLHHMALFHRDEQAPLPVAERVSRTRLSLPLYPQLGTDEVDAVVRAIDNFAYAETEIAP